MTTTDILNQYRKTIIYDRMTRDYAMYIDGELAGYARTHHEAEVTLDQLIFRLLATTTAYNNPDDIETWPRPTIDTNTDYTSLPDDGPIPGDGDGRCRYCEKQHSAPSCPDVEAMLYAEEIAQLKSRLAA